MSLDPSQPYSMPAVAPSAFNTDTPIISIYGTFSTQFALVPVKTVAPVISGTAQVGQTLTATAGTWANTPTSYAYQWNRGGTAINGAASSTYVPVAADVGNTLTVSVIATNGSGSSAPATSAPTAAVTSSSAIWPAANYANQGARGFNQPGDNSLGSYQAAAAYGANVMRVFINGNTGGGTNNLSDNGSQYRIGNGAYGTFDFTALDAIAANAQAAGLKVIWVIDDGKDLFTSSSLQNSFIAMWQAIATHYKAGTPYATTIVGYDLWNEPAINGSQAQWIPLSQNTASAIRAIDPDHVLIWEPFPWGLPYSYDGITTMPLAAFSNVVYSFHAYDPHLFTNNGVGDPYGVKYPNTSLACYSGGANLNWNAGTLGPDELNCDGSGRQTILNLQAQYGFPIFIGEFSAYTASVTNDNGNPSATDWVKDSLAGSKPRDFPGAIIHGGNITDGTLKLPRPKRCG
jgi:Cellulase (glycosyl hydrolase family 5)